VRDTEPRSLENPGVGPENIEIDAAWAPAFLTDATEPELDPEQRIEQGERLQGGFQCHRSVQKQRLWRADRLSFVESGNWTYIAEVSQLLHGAREQRAAVAQIGAETDDRFHVRRSVDRLP